MMIELLKWDSTVHLSPNLVDLFPEISADPISGKFGQDYFPSYSAGAGEKLAILVYADKKPGIIILSIVENGRFHLCGHPARFFWARDISPLQKATVAKLAFDYLDTLSEEYDVRHFCIEETDSFAEVSQVELKCMNRGASLKTKLVAKIDLQRDISAIWSDVRKSFRPLIKRGEREMTIYAVDARNPCKSLFDKFRDFHFKISGRRTRTIESWDVQFDFVSRGMGSLVVGFHESELVSGTLSVDGDDVSYYATGVYDRDKFNHPISHAPLWRSIVAAKERGRKTYNLGEVYPEGSGTSKERSIGVFKKGFTDTLAVSRVWQWGPDTEGKPV